MNLARKILTLFVFAALACSVRAEAWQYAIFSELSGQFNFAWQEGAQVIGANDFFGLVDKLANAGVIASGAKPKTIVALFDQLGAQGWELVTVHNQDQGRTNPTAVLRYFKRPVRS